MQEELGQRRLDDLKRLFPQHPSARHRNSAPVDAFRCRLTQKWLATSFEGAVCLRRKNKWPSRPFDLGNYHTLPLTRHRRNAHLSNRSSKQGASLAYCFRERFAKLNETWGITRGWI